MTRDQKIALAYWVGVFGVAVGAVDFALDKKHAGLTLSERVRDLKDSVPNGDLWWSLAYGAGSGWLQWHIHKRVAGKVEVV